MFACSDQRRRGRVDRILCSGSKPGGKYEERREGWLKRGGEGIGIFLRASGVIHSDLIRCVEHRSLKINLFVPGRNHERFSSAQT